MSFVWRMACVGCCLASSLGAQARVLTLTAAPSFVTFGDYGSFSAAALAVRGRWPGAGPSGVEVSMVAVLPLGSFSAIPSCPPSVPSCVGELRSPTALLSGLVGWSRSLGASWLRGSVGGGGLYASGMVAGHSNALALDGGIDATWAPPGRRSRVVLSLRGVVLSRDIVGMRALLVPGVGVQF